MTAPAFRVGYLDRPMHPRFAETLAAAPGIELVRFGLDEPEERVRAGLAACQGYYAQASRDELPAPWHVNAAFLATMPDLLAVASYGAGYDTIDVAACTAAGVAVTNQAGGNAEGVAEHAVGMMLTLLKRVPEGQAAMRAGGAARREAFMGRELAGRTVGLVGLGHIGSRVAAILRLAFGCRVLAHDPHLDPAAFARHGAERADLPDLLAASDVVSLHCPLSAETRGLFGADAFARMRPGAVFVSTARGSIHDEAALTAALESGHLGGAGLDVWEREPPPADLPLLNHPAVLASPHTAGVTHESRERVARMAAETFVEVASGRLPERLLNPEAGDRILSRLRSRAIPGG